MPADMFPECVAIIFGAEQRVFLTPEIADPLVGERHLARAHRKSYELCDTKIITRPRTLCSVFPEANPDCCEFSTTPLRSPLDPAQIAFLTHVDRVLVVTEIKDRIALTGYGRFLGATLFMDQYGPLPLRAGLMQRMSDETPLLHDVRLPDGRVELVHEDDFPDLLKIAQAQMADEPLDSFMHARLDRLCVNLAGRVECASQTAEEDPGDNVVPGPWGR